MNMKNFRPSYNALLRLKRNYKRNALPTSQLQDCLATAFKKRGLHWVRSELSWYK